MSSRIATRSFGALNMAVGALAIWGGGQEVLAYWPDAPLEIAVGSCGFLAGSLLALSGIGLWRGRPGARALAIAGGGGAIVAHGAGLALGFIGVAGILLGVAYPAVMMLWLRRHGPMSPRPADDGRDSGDPGTKAGKDRDLRRIESALA